MVLSRNPFAITEWEGRRSAAKALNPKVKYLNVDNYDTLS
jgi:hypothetical protein